MYVLRTWKRRLLVVLVGVGAGSSCRTAGASKPSIVQPGAPGGSSRVISLRDAVDLSRVQYTGADVQFMQNMIGHHAQALQMTAILSPRTSREDMRLLAKRIEASQADEIRMMQGWLEARGEDVPSAHEGHQHAQMPGMLTSEEMDQLADAQGSELDRLFLELMIKHHQGALRMVAEIFATPGAGQDSELFTFASDVEADQRMEIRRMTAMLLQGMQPRKPSPQP